MSAMKDKKKEKENSGPSHVFLKTMKPFLYLVLSAISKMGMKHLSAFIDKKLRVKEI